MKNNREIKTKYKKRKLENPGHVMANEQIGQSYATGESIR